MITTVLTDRANYKQHTDELMQAWLRDLLLFLGADAEWLDTAPPDLAVEYFLQNNLEIVKHTSIDALEVYHEGELVGEWAGPEATLKEGSDGSLFFEVSIEHWSIIEEEIEDSE
tara:strand:- start:3469 stop:3810 length:342 start_codon:yes stop_codon:yes gene_type:complete